MEHVSLMMAGAQLGITICSLGLGYIAKPAVSDLLKGLVTDGLVEVCFDLDEQPCGYPDEFMPQEQQVKKLHLCFDQSTYVFLTPKGRDEGVRILQRVNKDNCS
jgi:hypothetical protein